MVFFLFFSSIHAPYSRFKLAERRTTSRDGHGFAVAFVVASRSVPWMPVAYIRNRQGSISIWALCEPLQVAESLVLPWQIRSQQLDSARPAGYVTKNAR
jgi:hypothetical protein